MTKWEIFFAALIAICAAAGILFSSHLLEKEGRFRKQMFVYYTFLSNAASLLYHVLLLIPGGLRAALRTPPARFSAMLTILVTFLVYFFIITRFGRESPKDRPKNRLRFWGNILVHYAVPLLSLLEWLAVADKRGLGLRTALLWMIIPCVYLLFAIFYHSLGKEIEHSGRSWPYAFIDLEKIGLKSWTIRVVSVIAGFFILALAFSGIAAWISK